MMIRKWVEQKQEIVLNRYERKKALNVQNALCEFREKLVLSESFRVKSFYLMSFCMVQSTR